MRISLGYPSPEQEAAILEDRPGSTGLGLMRPALNAADVRALQARVDAVKIEESLRKYIVAIAQATRSSDQLMLGLSTRGALALAQAARAWAMLRGREYVIPEDITENVAAVGGHRVIARTAGTAEATGRVLEGIVRSVPSPA
jgi:MoxR-like ATPase